MRRHRLLAVVLVSFLLTAGCAAPGQGDELEDVQAMTLSPGTTASSPLAVNDSQVDGDLAAEDASISADEEGLNASLEHVQVDENGTLAGWYTVSASESLEEGERSLRLSLGDEEKTIPVTVETPEDPVQAGEIAKVTYSARTLDGELVMSNDENATEAPLPRAAVFQEPRQFAPVPAQLTENSQLPAELVEAITGAGIGHSLSVELSEFFGPETFQENRSRETTADREVTVPTEITYPPQQARQLLPPDVEEGDELDLPATEQGHRAPYVLEELGREQIRFSLALEEGETFTLYETWPDTAEVTNVGDEEATIYETPTSEEGDNVTWVDPWGNVSEVVSITEDEIVLRHSPEEGLTYERMHARSQQKIATEVVQVGPQEIVVEKTNPHPLAGDPLVFDVTVVDRQQPTQR